MSFLLFILLILFLLVGLPLLRGWFYMNSLRRRVNESFRGRQQHERPRQDEEEYSSTGERKIYTSGDGEYADFEEVSGTVIEETRWVNSIYCQGIEELLISWALLSWQGPS